MLKETKVFKFYEQVKQETLKIIWPNKKELMTATMIVVAAVFVFSIVCLVLDYGIHSIVQVLLNVGK
jgi:preprotein translocase subunit SecE